MKSKPILGLILLLLGAAILVYGHFSYQSRETVVEVGPIKATAEKTNTVPLPPILGWVLLGVGIVVLIVPTGSKT